MSLRSIKIYLWSLAFPNFILFFFTVLWFMISLSSWVRSVDVLLDYKPVGRVFSPLLYIGQSNNRCDMKNYMIAMALKGSMYMFVCLLYLCIAFLVTVTSLCSFQEKRKPDHNWTNIHSVKIQSTKQIPDYLVQMSKQLIQCQTADCLTHVWVHHPNWKSCDCVKVPNLNWIHGLQIAGYLICCLYQ